MSLKRNATIALMIVLVLTNAWSAYLLLDTGMALSDAGSEVQRQREVSKLLAALMFALPRGVGIGQAEALLKAKHPRETIKRSQNRLEIGNVALNFKGDALVRAGSLEMSDDGIVLE